MAIISQNTDDMPKHMKKISNISVFVLVALAIMLGFSPSYAKAYGYSYPNRYSYGSDYYYNYNPRPVYVQPVYVTQPVIVSQPVVVRPVEIINNQFALTSSCSAKVNYSTNTGVTTIVWSADPSGGNGYYSYSWTGTDGLLNNHKDAYFTYSNPGNKYASVTITSGNQTITVNCSPVNIPAYNVYPTNYYSQNYYPLNQNGVLGYSNNLDVGCYADPINAKIDQPITWTAEVSNAISPVSYSWSGSESLTSNQSSVIKYYGTTGTKSAVVTITSADGRTMTKACSNAVTVSSAKVASATTKVVASTKPANVVSSNTVSTPVTEKPVVTLSDKSNTPNQSASAILSLGSIPWGWVSIMIIFLLFFTIMYLLFNKKKV